MWKVERLVNLVEEVKTDDNWHKQYETKTSYVLHLGSDLYNFALESVIQHHQEAVSSVQWRGSSLADLKLLSSSFDFTVVHWVIDPETETWTAESTLGALVGNKHAFFGAIYLGSDEDILAYTYGGAMHQWHR